MHENVCKSLHEGTANCWSFFQDVNLERQSPLGVFLREQTIFDLFLTEGRGATFVTPVCVHRKCYISMYFLRKAASNFLPREKISCFREKKYHISRQYKKDHVPARPFLERPSFQKVWRKYHISVFFWFFLRKIIFHFPSRVWDHIFGEKKYYLFR